MKLHVKRGGRSRAGGAGRPAVVAHAVPVLHAAPMRFATGCSRRLRVAASSTVGSPRRSRICDADLHILKSPIVGTFYESPSPGAPPFVNVGDSVKEGQVLCIIEAMKLMNEIEAEVSGDRKMFVAMAPSRVRNAAVRHSQAR